MMPHLTRRAALLGLGLGLAAAVRPVRAASAPLRIGYQKFGSLVILRSQGTLEHLLALQGVPVAWVEFNAGPPLLEALNAGAVDFGGTGDTPPIFAQAAGSSLLYVGAQPLRGENEALLIRDGSPVRTVADLRGRRVGYTRGSSAHNFVVKALQQAGLTLSDIQSVALQPADAAAAFRSGALDAWAIWDPFLAVAQQDPAAKVLIQSQQVEPSNNFFLARRAWVASAPDQLIALLGAINGAAAWATANPDALAELMTQVTGVPLAAQRLAAPRGTYAVQPMDEAIIAQQQEIADTFARLRIIPSRINVRQAVWTPPGRS